MTTLREIYEYIDRFAPFDTAEGYDNPGLLLGDMDREVKKALLCLDAGAEVIQEGIQKEADLLISHHPVIFTPLKKIHPDAPVYRLISADLPVLSAHTNLDRSEKGTSRLLAKTIGLSSVEAPEKGEGFLLVGALAEAVSPEDFAKRVKECLFAKGIRYLSGNRPVKRVALCAGSGGSMLSVALEEGADAYLTGDIKHDVAVEAKNRGITLVDGGHYETEVGIKSWLFMLLSEQFPEVEWMISQSETAPFAFL